MTNTEARIFSKILKETSIRNHGLYAEKTNDYSDPYLNQWVERCNNGMYGAFWSGGRDVHRIMAEVLGTKRYWGMASAFRKQNGGWKNESEWMEKAGL